jgi:eukaryotic-like serine/threonine-protein kinase
VSRSDDDHTGDDTLAQDTVRDPARKAPRTTGLAAPHDPATRATDLAAPALEPQPSASLPGYIVGARIGQGGMGEVVLGRDLGIGRDVAIKRLRGDDPGEIAVNRFLREARIQARLEHPAIVPVHTVGVDASGRPFFTMKRLTGETLEQKLGAATPPSQQELLRALVDVCRAIELAHSRGVIHRDLKPANIMLGNFGEVYVLDWGVARIVDATEAVASAGDVDSLDGLTQAGALFGTPGYMAPEQLEASPEIGPPADVYALGAILFEILGGEPLHPRGNKAAMASMLAGVDPSPARRHPERGIPPELDQLCVRVLATAPADRPNVRTLADGIQRYLDGDRDHERRRELARTELAGAREAVGRGDRARAIRSAGRALALDPDAREPAILIASLMLEPPKTHPPDLVARLAASDVAVQRRQSRVAVLALLTILAFLGGAALEGPRDGVLLAGLAVVTTSIAALSWSALLRPAGAAKLWTIAVGNAILAAVLSRLFGSLIIAPVITCIMAVSLTSYPQLMHRARYIIAMLVASWLAPIALEAGGVLERTWRVDPGEVVSMSPVFHVGGPATGALLVIANVLAIIVIGLFANALARSRRTAQRDVEIQAWQLRQLLPDREPIDQSKQMS